MPSAAAIDTIVFDILGTMVDEPGGLRVAIREVSPAADDSTVADRLGMWQQRVEREQERIASGERPYANSDDIDREAASRIADAAGRADPTTIEHLASAGRRLPAWSDSAAGLARLAERFAVLGLSNASRASLLRLNAYAGLRWHQVLSAEAAGAYKPAPEVYRLAIDAAGGLPERVLMVAAHAWDLRGAQAVGMRTAYVHRPVGDPPTDADQFDWYATDLDDLATQLREP